MTPGRLLEIAALLDKATPDAVFAFGADELSALIAYVRELERQRDAVAAAVADGLRALDADVIGTGPARKPKRDHGGSTHWDIAEAGAVCHDDCAIEQIKAAALAMRERCAQRAESAQANGSDCAAAIRALEV